MTYSPSAGDSLEIHHGSKIGRFVVVGELGSGGMGVVYAAHDRELDRQVALKVLRRGATTDEERMRMLREGQAMARITHPNVITVFEVGSEGSLVFLAQELLDGGTLGQWLQREHAEPAILEKLVAAGRGLAAAHAAGLVHRDFKPDNVLLGKDGRVRVADFGLARALGPDGERLATTRPGRTASVSDTAATSPMAALTRTGAVMGTPMFMSPEQHDGQRADERSDQFSFCVALYHALYRDWPFDGKTAVALADAVIGGRRKPAPKGRRVSSTLRKIIDRGLAIDPAARYPSMAALLADLEAAMADRGTSKRVLAIGGALAVLGAGAAVAFAVLSSAPANKQRSAAAPRDAAVVPVEVAVDAAAAPTPTAEPLDATTGMVALIKALERGQLEAATATFTTQAKADGPSGGIAAALAGYTLALRGKLDEAETRIAEARKVGDSVVRAHADLASAAAAWFHGDLAATIEHGRSCAVTKPPRLGALCLQLVGDAHVERGEVVQARAAYSEAKALVDGLAHLEHSLAISLAVLDADEATIKAQQEDAIDRGDLGVVAQARIARTTLALARGDNTSAFDVLKGVTPEAIENTRARLLHQILHAQATILLGDPEAVSGLDGALAEAKQLRAYGLELAARLARAAALVDDEATATALAEEARKRGFERLARLAETAADR